MTILRIINQSQNRENQNIQFYLSKNSDIYVMETQPFIIQTSTTTPPMVVPEPAKSAIAQ